MSWAYEFSVEAQRQLRDLGPSAAADIKQFLEKRICGAAEPTAFGTALRGDLKGFWRYRVKDYRVLCRIEAKRVVVIVVAVGHRSIIYDD